MAVITDTVSQMRKVLVFGVTGALGASCAEEFETAGWSVTDVGRDLSGLPDKKEVHAAVWAQGANHTGSIENTSDEDLSDLWEANVLFIIKSIKVLLESNAFVPGARMVVLGSVWQEVARQNKLAYITTKSAVGGLVRALAVDLGERHIAINAVLPGVVDSPMTRKNLSTSQIEKIQRETPSSHLVTAKQIARVVRFLASEDSAGINGQSILVDDGWTKTRYV